MWYIKMKIAHVDNKGVVDAAKRMVAKDPLLMECFRSIQVMAALNNFVVKMKWIEGEQKNTVADAISRRNFARAFQVNSQLDYEQTPIAVPTPHTF